MVNISTRSLQPTDQSRWQELWAKYNAFYGREGETALSEKMVLTSWDRLMDEAEPVYGLVAEQDGVLVGIAHYIFHRNMIQMAHTCYMQDLFTDDTSRRLGVGQKLIEAMVNACRDKGVSDIYWNTHTSNKTSQKLYDRLAKDTEFLVYRMTAHSD